MNKIHYFNYLVIKLFFFIIIYNLKTKIFGRPCAAPWGAGGEIFDDHTYYGWYQGDPEVRKLEHPRTRACIANPVPL